MAQNTSNKTTTKSFSWFVYLVSFIAVVCVGVSLLLANIGLGGKISSALNSIANIIAYLVLIVVSSFYIAKKKTIWLWVLWAVSVVLIIISYVI